MKIAYENSTHKQGKKRKRMKSDADVPAKFKPRLREIQEARLADRRFQELWEEYCELVDSVKPLEGGMKTLNRLKEELENDIEEALQNKYGK